MSTQEVPMRPFLAARVPAALATAIAVTGCVFGAPNGTDLGKKGPFTYEQKVKKVDNLTRALSLEKNDGLKRASESIQRLVEALAGIMQSPAAVPASSAGAARYQLRRALSEVTAAGAQATYDLAGVHEANGVTILYDDATKEVTGLESPTAKVAFKYVNNGRKRSFEAEILKSPDGTTGTIAVEVEGEWSPQPTPQPYQQPTYTVPKKRPSPIPRPAYPTARPAIPLPPGTAFPSPAYPAPVASGWSYPSPAALASPYAYPSPYVDPSPPAFPATTAPSPTPTAEASPDAEPVPTPAPSATGAAAYTLGAGPGEFDSALRPAPVAPAYDPDDEDPGEQDYGYEEEEETPEPAWTPAPPPPYKIFGGEYPSVVESVAVKLDVVPRGDKSLAFQLDGTFDQPEAFPGATFKVPTHWNLKMRVPKVKFDWDSTASLQPGASTFKCKGGLTVAGGPDGEDRFTFGASFVEATKAVSMNLTHVDAKIKLLAEGKVGQVKPDRAVLLSTDDGKELGEFEGMPDRPGAIVIKLHEGGKKIIWEPLPRGFNPMGFMPMPAPPPPMPATTPLRRPTTR